MLESGAQPLQDLIAALHTKLIVAELERHRASRGWVPRFNPHDESRIHCRIQPPR